MAALKITGQSAEPTVTASDAGTLYYDSTAKVLKVYNGASWENLSQDDKIRQDVTTLALRQAIGDNAIAYNLPNSFIDQFQDSTGVGTFTDSTRDSADEYISTAFGGFTSDSDTELLLHLNESPFTDSSGNSFSVTTSSGCVRSAAQSKFGGYSAYFDGSTNATSGGIFPAANAAFAFGGGDYTLEAWVMLIGSTTGEGVIAWEGAYSNIYMYRGSATAVTMYGGNGSAWSPIHGRPLAPSAAIDTWHHLAISRDGDTLRSYHNGVAQAGDDVSGFSVTNNKPVLGRYSGVDAFTGYIDEVRISSVCRYPDGTTFIPAPPTATGTINGNANVPSAAQTKVSGVMLYKHVGSGASVIGTHLKIYFTCNGGTNWTEAASYTSVTPDFSTGIKMVKLGETTCTSGSDIRYKAVWATQSDGVIDTQLHGIGLNY